MNKENEIIKRAEFLTKSNRKIEFAHDISEKSKEKWKEILKDKAALCDCILISALSPTGSFAITGNSIICNTYIKKSLYEIKYKSIEAVKAKKGGVFKPDSLLLSTTDKNTIEITDCFDSIDIEQFSELLLSLAKIAKENDSLVTSKQIVNLCDLPEEIKLIYLKILCNYCYINKTGIPAAEYNAISSFSVRMNFSYEKRKDLRNYMNDLAKRDKTGNLLNKVENELENETGAWNTFRYSIMQDVLFLSTKKTDTEEITSIDWRNDGFIGSFMESLGLIPEQIETMCKAVILNQKMLQKEADYVKLNKEWKETFKNQISGTKAFVPEIYLFCSGSIFGIKAYTGFFKKSSTSQKAINKQREFILHEIILNNQKTTNCLIEDLNILADTLEKEQEESGGLKAYNDLLQKKLERLALQKNTTESKLDEFSDIEQNGDE